MPIQKRTVDIRSVLGMRAPELPRVPNAPLASGFSEGESVIKKRKKGEEEAEVAEKQQVAINTEPFRGQVLVQKGTSCGGQIADALGSALLLPKDMKNWKGNNSTQMIENLKRDSVVAVQGVFEAGYRLIEAERLLNESLAENDRLREVEKVASARIREVESQHKTAEEGLQKAECQLVEMSAKLERECERSSGFQAEIDKLKAELAEARQVSSNAENEAQATYDRGFADAAGSLRLQLRRECNIHFLKGWALALEQAAVDDESELYVLGRRYRPYDSGTPENLEETNVEVLGDCEAFDGPTAMENAEVFDHQERAQTEEVQDMEKGVSDKEDNVNVDD
uniref:Uncharacterized protein n=1 Tax=Fagus sylvatica TaxID=28930 RepID=A0A2N9G8W7_FAGSY